jgi:hypothetical protein
MQSLWRRGLFYFILSVLAGLAMVSSESIWIDEGQTVLFARQPTFREWFTTLSHSFKSEAQMPLGMFVAWIGGKLIGLDEWSLRAVNLLWVGLAGTAMGLIGRQLNKPALLPIFLVHPFLWFYTNEARPYAVQICAGAWLLYVLVRAHRNGSLSAGDVWVFGLASVAGYGSSLLFAFGVLGAVAGMAVLWRRGLLRIIWSTRHWLAFATACVLLAVITMYYCYTLKRGASGAKIWNVTPMNLAFALYEMLGFSGLGPPRNELREMARNPSQLGQHLLQIRFLLGLGCAALLQFAVAARLWKLRKDPLVQWLSASVLAVGVSLYAAATIVHFPFWGRHLAPLLPFIVLLVTNAVVFPQDSHSPVRRHALLAALLVCLGISSLALRFGVDYRKDDYRSASRIALNALAAGQVVWWSADPEECAAYYGLPSKSSSPVQGGRLIFCYQPTEKDITGWPEPDVILQSKPDIHDFHGQLRSYLEKAPYQVVRQLPAFTVWSRKHPAPNGAN